MCPGQVDESWIHLLYPLEIFFPTQHCLGCRKATHKDLLPIQSTQSDQGSPIGLKSRVSFCHSNTEAPLMSYGHRTDGKLSPEPSFFPFFPASPVSAAGHRETTSPDGGWCGWRDAAWRDGEAQALDVLLGTTLPACVAWAGYPSLSSRCLLYEMNIM